MKKMKAIMRSLDTLIVTLILALLCSYESSFADSGRFNATQTKSNQKKYAQSFFGRNLIDSFNSIVATSSGDLRGTVVYGEDNRLDLFEVKDQFQISLALSTVALFDKSDVIDQGNGTFHLRGTKLGVAENLCKSERFYEQPSGAFCSGSLVGEDLIMTAGHCAETLDECLSERFVFGYNLTQEGVMPNEVAKSEVYSCKAIVARFRQDDGADYGIIKLDRSVTNHKPLKLNRKTNLTKDTQLTVIGYPTGIPAKVAVGAKVRNPDPKGYFVANLDTYKGNSGSAVFNSNTGLVEGILVRGERDYVKKGDCYVSNVCPSDGCRGEDATKVSEVLKFVPEI